jgi:ABC-type nitrate/sulfonate/bicarbonate transport system substrate-binding protein
MRSLPLFVALERQMFEKAGLNVKCEPFESPAEGLKELAEDRTDLCITIPIVSLITAEADKPGTVRMLYLAVLSADGGNDAILVRRNSTMASPAELRGRRLGIPPGKTNRAFARLALRPYLGDKPAVTIVELPMYEMLNALKNRNVMALLAFEPTISQGEEQEISRVLVRGALARAIMDPMPIAGAAIKMSFVEENPKTTRKLLAVLFKAADYVRKNEDEARRIANKHLRLKENSSGDLPLSTFWMLPELDEERRDRLQQFADLLHREEILEKPYLMERLYLEQDLIPRHAKRSDSNDDRPAPADDE